MTSLRNLISAVLVSAVIASCSSTSKTSTDSGSTTTTSSATTVAGAATTTATTAASASATTTPATAAQSTTPPTTKATTPATAPATTAAPQIITSFSVSNAASCAAPDSSFPAPNPSVTVSWTVVGADSVSVSMDSEGGLWDSGLPLSGSTTVPASCDADGHNVHTYYVIAIKGGQKIASKNATRGS